MQHSCATVVHQKQRENMPHLKKPNNRICDFCIPEKQGCFWVGVVMQAGEPGHRKQQNMKSYIYLAATQKPQKTPY